MAVIMIFQVQSILVFQFQTRWDLFPVDPKPQAAPSPVEKKPEATGENDNDDCSLFQPTETPQSPPKRMFKGLSELTRRCFGKPLDKSECLSNWERRPLRKAQLRYAALDAYVLIKIHDYVQERSRQLNVKFDFTSHNRNSNNFLGYAATDDA